MLNAIFRFVIHNLYWLGFVLSTYLSVSLYQTTNRTIDKMQGTFSTQADLYWLQENELWLQNLLSGTSVSLALGSSELLVNQLAHLSKYRDTDQLTPSDPELYDQFYDPIAAVSSSVRYISKKWAQGKVPTKRDLKQIVDKVEGLGLELNKSQLISWRRLQQQQHDFLRSYKGSSYFTVFMQLTLSLLLAAMMWLSIKKVQAEKGLRASEQLHRFLLGSLQEGVLFCLSSGEVLSCNSSLVRLLNLENKSVVGRKIYDVLPPVMNQTGKFYEQEQSPWYRILQQKQLHGPMSIGVYAPDGGTRWLSLRVSPMAGQNSMILSFADITEEFESKELVFQQQKQMAEISKMSALGEMASGIAHEINNPLTIIHMEAEELEYLAKTKGHIESDTAVSVSKNIAKTVERITKIIRGLRSFSREEGENDPFVLTNIGEVIEDAIVLAQSKAKKIQATVELAEIPQALHIDCRPVQLGQVLLNLLGNAFDAIEDLEEKWVKVSVSEMESWIEIMVEDSGSGIPLKIQEKIFNPFFTTKDIGQGTGLGMSISKSIVESHHGELFIDSNSNHTRFVIRLPRVQHDTEKFVA